MAVRTVTVRLRADISNYTRGMRQASDTTSRLANAGAATGAAMLAGFAVAAAAAAKFDKALSNVRAVTGASTGEMAKLRAAALEAGKTTSFTATEAANAEAELARAGVSTANIIGGALKGSLALAASGQVDLTEAAVVSAQAMNTFGLAGKDVTHIADLLAAGANKSAADVHGLSMSLRMGGLLAHQTGMSIEDTVGTLAAFADHALIGSDAGTSLKVMLQRLVPQSKEAQGAMDAIGFSAYDSSGKFVGLSELAGRMKTSFSKLTPEARNSAMATIFGADAVRSATILYELGSEGINRYVTSVDDAGAAQRMAAIQTDNLIGDLERLRGALEVALIEGGSAANGALRSMTQWITALVNAYNSLPPGLQHAVTGFMGVGGAIAFAGGAMLLLLPRIAATRAALTAMGVTATTVRSAMMMLGRMTLVVAGLAAVSYGVETMMKQFDEAPPNVTKLTNSLVDLALKGKAGGELTKAFGEDLDKFGTSVARIAHAGVLDRVGDSLYNITHLGSDGYELTTARENVKSLDEALSGLVQAGSADVAAKAFQQMAVEAEAQGTSTEKLRTLLPQYAEALSGADTQQKLAAESQAGLGDAAEMTADQMKDQRTEAEKLADALKTLNGVAISTAEQEIGFRKSLADLSAAVKENGHSLDVTTEKGRAVKGAFLDAAKSAMEYAQSVAEQTGSQEQGQAVLEKNVGLLRAQMDQAGFSKDAIDKLTSAYLQLPAAATTKVNADTAAAVKDLQAVQNKIRTTKGKNITVKALTGTAEKALKNLGYKVTHMKDGSARITVPTGTPISQVGAIQRAINGIQGKPVGIGVYLKATASDSDANGVPDMIQARAKGAVVDYYANGGMRENHVAQIAPAGSWRVWGEPETGGEAYIPLARGKRPRSRQIAAETVGRLGGRVEWFASGGLNGFTYTPTGQPVLGGPSDAKSRYDKEVEDLKKAWADLSAAMADAKKKADAVKEAEKNLARVRKGRHTAKQLDAAEDKLSKARKAAKKSNAKVSEERQDVYDANAALGVKKGSKAPASFNLGAYQKQLNNSLAATTKWRTSLAKIGQRGGAELKAMLENMGEEGYSLVNALAGASNAQFADIVKKLEATGELAKATLADFTKQLGGSTKESQQFAKDLQTLAAQGFGDLAQALAAQGDGSAMALARQAASGSSRDVAAANAAVKANQTALTGDDLVDSLVLLSTLRGKPGAGFAELIAAGLDTATIRALVPRMMAQINSLPAANKDAFLRQFAGQGGVTAMARGGVLTGPGLVLGGEAGVPESWIPHDGSARSRALLATTARALGYDARPAGRWGAGRAAGAAAHYDQRTTTVTLNGAKQTAGEQAADIARHLTFIG
ncbi:phage tail tape measure protein [Streptomyces sp. NPDC001822]|uniref:phage tail tape measure protein n=1 Tax=Streptomyces sp. NPDC001822 TaxID=3364614 RepID=UPI00368A7844